MLAPTYFGCLLVTVIVGSALGSQEPESTEEILKSLCTNNSKQSFDLTRSSQIESLVELLDSRTQDQQGPGCPERTLKALRDLHGLIQANSRHVCSLKSVSEIRQFYEAYITASLSGGEEPLLAPIKNFFLGYGLRVSSSCKKNMIPSLQYDGETMLSQRDHDLIEPWTNEQSLISQLMNEPGDYDDILLPRDLNQILNESSDSKQGPGAPPAPFEAKVFLQTKTGHTINTMKAVCQRRFKPIYEQLILPLIYLSNMGFNYQGEELGRELKEMSLNKGLHQWYRIVYLCESIAAIEIVEDPRDAGVNEGSDKKLVHILTPEEAAQFKAERGVNQDKDQFGDQLEQLVYKQEFSTQLTDQILDKSDRNLMKLVHSFATHKTELDRIRAKLIKKLTKFIVNKLKHGQFKIVGSLLGVRSSSDQWTDDGDGNREVVSALDKYVDQVANPDGPVAGTLKQKTLGVTKRYYHHAATNGVAGISSSATKAFDKVKVRSRFWYVVAVSLFVVGIILLSCAG